MKNKIKILYHKQTNTYWIDYKEQFNLLNLLQKIATKEYCLGIVACQETDIELLRKQLLKDNLCQLPDEMVMEDMRILEKVN